jgi:hypothetical protein
MGKDKINGEALLMLQWGYINKKAGSIFINPAFSNFTMRFTLFHISFHISQPVVFVYYSDQFGGPV